MQPSSSVRQLTHRISMEDRNHASITGVEDVDCFNEQIVILRTPLGMLTITGSGLNISHLNLEEGRVEIDGEFEAAEYTGGKKTGGIFSRLLR